MSERLFLIDAMAQIYRMHFAIGRHPLITSKGENVSAVYGFINTLLALIDRENPDKLAVVYDSPHPTFRHHIYKEYKATREKMPDELAAQLPRLEQILRALNIPIVVLPGYEADDLIGTLAKEAEMNGMQVYMVTGDKDYYQLVTNNVFFYSTKQGLSNAEVLYPDDVKKIFGVLPGQVIDVLGLAGDSSDNVPGVPKVGIKTALSLLSKYENMEEALNHWKEVGGKVGENLREYREQAIISKNLVTIRTTAPIAENIEDLNFGPLDTKEARKLFTELEFKRLLNYLDKGKKVLPPEERKVVYKSVVNESELMSMIKKLSKSPRIAIDTETTSIDPNQAELVGLSFSSKQGDAYYIPVNYFSFSDQDEISGEGRPLSDCGDTTERLLERLRTLLEIGPGKIAQNAKYDFLLLKRYGIQVNPLVFDPMLADYLINPGARGHSIDAMALNYLNIKKIETAELIGKGKSQVTMDRVPLEIITKYACEDAEVAFALSEVLEHRIEEEELSDLLREIELPVSHVLMEMEYNGIKLELNSLGKMSKEMNEQISELEAECHLLAGIEFNLNSTQELSHILFDKLNMSTKLSRKTKTGFYSTDQSVLERLAPIDPLPKKLLEHRSLRKLVSTYVDALPKLVNQRTGRLHTTYNQTVAATGRLSSNNPNLQNIPIRSDMGAEIRRAFIAEQDHLLLSADYSQVELRMMAHLSNDAGLIEAFENGEDIHRTTASKVFNVTPEHVSVQQRSAAKAVNFGVLFGMREFGLSSRLGISKKQAKEFIDGYFGAYPKVEVFIKNLLDQARSDGYVKTILGRRRPIPDLVSSNRNVMQGAERAAIATAVQGSAADLIKVAMIRLQRDLDQGKHPFKMLLQVHDELIFEVHEDVVEEAAAWAKDKMETAMKLSVPLIVDTGWGKNWLEAH